MNIFLMKIVYTTNASISALTNKGEVFSFGENASGQLGHGNFESQHQPLQIEALKDVKISSISCGMDHSGVVTGTIQLSSLAYLAKIVYKLYFSY